MDIALKPVETGRLTTDGRKILVVDVFGTKRYLTEGADGALVPLDNIEADVNSITFADNLRQETRKVVAQTASGPIGLHEFTFKGTKKIALANWRSFSRYATGGKKSRGEWSCGNAFVMDSVETVCNLLIQAGYAETMVKALEKANVVETENN